MKKKDKKILYLTLAIIGIVILVWVFFLNSSGGGGGFNLYKKQATCTVTVSNGHIIANQLDVSNDAYCTSKKTIVCNPFSIIPVLGIVSTSGNLVFESAGIQNNVAVDVVKLTSKKYTISVCGMPVDTTTGTLKAVVNSVSSNIVQVSFP